MINIFFITLLFGREESVAVGTSLLPTDVQDNNFHLILYFWKHNLMGGSVEEEKNDFWEVFTKREGSSEP